MPQLAEQTAPRLFISYSHDSAEHEDRVLAFADRLRHDGIDALIDQYDTAPPDGWPMWMDRQIQKADFVALVCTETYLRRVEGRELPGMGRGVLWEAKLIFNMLYPEDFNVQKFIPVLFAGGQSSYIPLPIRGSTYYRVDSAEGYEDFYRHLTGQPRHGKPALGKLKALPAIEPQSYPASLETTQPKPPTSLDEHNRFQNARGTGIAQAFGQGATATVNITGFTPDQIATLLKTAGAAQQARVNELATQLNTSRAARSRGS